MKKYTNAVVPWQQLGKPSLEHKEVDFSGDIKNQLDDIFDRQMKAIINADRPIAVQACDLIIKSKGGLTVSELAERVGLGERQLERLFSKYVGLSPKRYIRLIRFNHIFKLMQAEDVSWCQLAIDSGYYDQSHFIKEFREFSGEHPSKYGFNDDTFANFFLKPK